MDISEALPEDKETARCPYCRDLPVHAITNGIETTPIEIKIVVLDESETEPRDVTEYSDCTLYLVVNSLRRIWSGKAQFPLTTGSNGGNRDKLCIKDLCLSTDPTTPIHNLDVFSRGSIRYAPIHQDPSNALVNARIQRWISHCAGNHPTCRVDELPLLPTRVLDVTYGHSTEEIRLVESTKEQRGVYVALSHCWGRSSNPFITTRDNYKQMQNGFSPDIAPATFRDAIKLTQRLGIRYLWIDSLCIIQGDRKDWEVEASRMAKIYQDATLTISASYASADTEGFLKPRPSLHSTVKRCNLFVSNAAASL